MDPVEVLNLEKNADHLVDRLRSGTHRDAFDEDKSENCLSTNGISNFVAYCQIAYTEFQLSAEIIEGASVRDDIQEIADTDEVGK